METVRSEPERILNVDDDEAGRYATTRLMTRAGYRVVEAADGAGALAAAQERVPDLVILDVNLPDMTGFEVARRLKADSRTAGIPILHLSATQIDSDSVARGLEGGADGYLVQPVEPVVLLATVRALLRVRAAEKERERLIGELRESGTFLEQVLAQVPVGVLLAEAPSGRLISANEQAARIWGLPALVAEDLEGYRKFPAFRRDGRPLAPEEWPIARAIRKGERVAEEEIAFLYRGGERRVMRTSAAPIRDAKGQLVAGVMGFVDVTDRVRMQEQLARTVRLLETTMENTRAHLAYLDRDFNFVLVNTTYAEGSRRTRAELIGRNHFALFPDRENEAVFRQVRDTGRAVEFLEKPFSFIDQPGRGVTYWDWTLVPVKAEGGEVEGLVLSLVDVTEQVKQRQQLVEVERQRRELAETLNAETSHRVKNNLAMAAGLLQIQMMEEADPHVISVLRDTTARLLTFADIHTQLSVTRTGEVELLDAMRRIADVNCTTFGLSHADVSVEGEPVSCPARAGTTVSIIANELVTNAVKHGRPGPDGRRRVRIVLRRREGRLLLSVWDSGNPVAADFDPGQQRGMGLRLVRELAAGQLQGHLSLRPEGGGTLAEVDIAEARLRPES